MKRRFQGLKLLLSGVLILSLLPVGALASEGPPSSYTSSTGIKLTVREIPWGGAGDGVYVSMAGLSGSQEGLYDAEGNLLCILDGETIDRTGTFRFGMAPAEIFDPNTAEEGYGYIDKYGKIVVEPKYDYADSFTEDGLALVRDEKGQYGYLDSTGKEVIPCQYNAATEFDNGYAVVQEMPDSFTQSLKVIDTTGKTVWECPTLTSSDGWNTFVLPIYDYNWPGRQSVVDGVCAFYEHDSDAGVYYPVLVDVVSGSVQEVPALAFETYDRGPTYLGAGRFRYLKNNHAAVLDLEGNVIIPYGSTFNDYCFWGFVETDDGIADLNGNLVLPVGGDAENAWREVTLYEDGRMTGQWPNVYKLFEIVLDDGSSTPEPEPEPEPEPAQDVPSSWATEQVNAAIAAGLVPESLQSKYTQTATRAEFCALAVELYETVKGAEITERATFTDTDDVNVQKMAALGVVGGVGDGKFNPGGELTREQAATILARLAEAIGQPLPGGEPAFADNSAISSWAFDAVGQVKAAGIMDGTGNNNFSPLQPYTREQCMMTILRMYELME